MLSVRCILPWACVVDGGWDCSWCQSGTRTEQGCEAPANMPRAVLQNIPADISSETKVFMPCSEVVPILTIAQLGIVPHICRQIPVSLLCWLSIIQFTYSLLICDAWAIFNKCDTWHWAACTKWMFYPTSFLSTMCTKYTILGQIVQVRVVLWGSQYYIYYI